MLVHPDNDPQWLVTAVLGGDAPEPEPADAETLRLKPGQRLRIESHDGTGLVDIDGTAGEVRLRLLGRDLAVDAPGRLRLSGTVVELDGRESGVEIRTDHDVTVRGRKIRLN